MNGDNKPDTGPMTKIKGIFENLAGNIALIVLLSYVSLLFLLTLISCRAQVSAQSQWLELTKTGFTTLGSALTLILGYYFGQKQVAEEAKRETKKTSEELDKEKQKTSELVANLVANPTPSEPENLRDSDKSLLQQGIPAGAKN
jgi:hypothetical protein